MQQHLLFLSLWLLLCNVFVNAQDNCFKVQSLSAKDFTRSNNLPNVRGNALVVLSNMNTTINVELSHGVNMEDVSSLQCTILLDSTAVKTDIPVAQVTAVDSSEPIKDFAINVDLPNGHSTISVQVKNLNADGVEISECSTTIENDPKLFVYGIPGALTILPPVITLVIAMITKNVLLSLFTGVILASTFMNYYNPILGLMYAMDTVIPGTIADFDHAAVLMFCWMLSGMVAVMSKSGGAAGLAKFVIDRAATSFSGQLCTWILGLFIFFDDYAAALIVGNTVRPIADKLRISREKLAFLVDGTAAPIASIAPISSWVGFEMSLIRQQFDAIGLDKPIYLTYLRTIPMRYYSIFLIIFCGSLIFSQRDFGPMLVAEEKARKGEDEEESEDQAESNSSTTEAQNPMFDPLEGVTCRWYNAVVPVLSVIFVSFVGMAYDGYTSLSLKEEQGESVSYALQELFGNARSFQVLLWAAFASYIVPVCMYWYQGIMGPERTTHYYIEGLKDLMEAMLVLILAWALGDLVISLNLSSYVIQSLESIVTPLLLPTIVFLLSGFMSFCTGSSWSTMSILFPIVIPLAWEVTGNDYEQLLQSVASVLAGSVFGDHCSPISDTTVLVSLATKCSIPSHIATQFPYAMTIAVITVAAGTLPTATNSVYTEWLAIPVGGALILSIIFLVGKPVPMFYGSKPEEGSDESIFIELHDVPLEQRVSVASSSNRSSIVQRVSVTPVKK